MQRTTRTALCLLVAAAWFWHGGVMTAHGHGGFPVPSGASSIEAAHSPTSSTRTDEHGLAPCALCAQQTAGEVDIPAAVTSSPTDPQHTATLGSLRSKRPFRAVLGFTESPRPPPLSTARV